MNSKGDWKRAPVYDLTFSLSSHRFQTTLIAGEGKLPGRKQLIELAKTFDLKNADAKTGNMKNVIANSKNHAQGCGVSNESIVLISNALSAIAD
jgi:serine/threonine-protein kinase HipA